MHVEIVADKFERERITYVSKNPGGETSSRMAAELL